MRLALALAALVAAAPAHSQNCGARDEVLATLATKYGEAQAFVGLTGQDEVVTIYISPATGTWTALVLRTDGMACLVAAGTNGEVRQPEAVIPGVMN